MCLAMALYGTEKLTPEQALKLGVFYFSLIRLPVTGAGYYEYLIRGDHVGDHDLIEVTLDELTQKIQAGEVSSFRLYNEVEGIVPWRASYGYNTDDYGSFFHLDAQSSGESSLVDCYVDLFREVSLGDFASYGIAYKAGSVSKGLSYAAGENFTSIYPFESVALFKKELPGRNKGLERYKGEQLRMVYELNLINARHLSINVGGIPLRQWILEGNNNGKLVDITDSKAIWLVEKEQLEIINRTLGGLGVLLSWKAATKKPFPKKIF